MDKGILKLFLFLVFTLIVVLHGYAQLPVPVEIGKTHPRCFGKNMSRQVLQQLVTEQASAKQIIDNTADRIDKYLTLCEKQPDWLLSRLQMYWKSKATQVYINGGLYDHADGEAPAPTVKFIGGRGTKTYHRRPALENVLPYMDDPRGLYLERNDEAGKWEWVSISGTGGTVASVNQEILGLARDAAFLYWYTETEAYGKLAFGVLDTYLTGIYYLHEPIDLSHGHHQTLVGYTQFEVIQEHYIAEVTQIYDFLYTYITKNHSDKNARYTVALQKWADQVIKNGVSFNNWNIFQAGHVSRIALVLENNSAYENGKGAQYYLDQIMNQTSTRQWSLTKLLEYGYDTSTGIWNESPGYSLGVLRDLIHLVKFYDHSFGIDLVEKLPILKQAVLSSAQYLNPNGDRITFGDGHYAKLDAAPILYMIENAQKYGRKTDEIVFTKMLKTIFNKDAHIVWERKNIEDLFAEKTLSLREDIVLGTQEDFTSPLFYAPNASWLVQRQNGLMISEFGSLGNHMHSNGISMELYGYGLPLAPEMGHGSSYFSIEYAEYYTQFPAHNTVIVNGKSKYPEMKSNHAFVVNSAYPKSGKQRGIFPGVTFSDVSFLEPETYSDQRRVMGIISDGDIGYYIDIFRSKQREGKDVKHEYFYHNLGQQFDLKNTAGNLLNLKSTTKMAFGDGDLMAYDYMWDKKSTETSEDFTGQFRLQMKEKPISMNLWVKGERDREVFSALSPRATALSHGLLPDGLHEMPVPTLVIRQNGEAWTRPFIVVYEPTLNGNSHIQSVDYFGEIGQTGIHVTHTSGREDFIFSTPEISVWSKGEKSITGSYGVIAEQGNDMILFLGNGNRIASRGYQLQARTSGYFAFKNQEGIYGYEAQYAVELTIPIKNTKAKYRLQTEERTYPAKVNKKTMTATFSLPATDYSTIQILAD